LLAEIDCMRVLEARFHPRRRGQPDVVMVGYLIWRRGSRRAPPAFEPGASSVPDPVLMKLRYLVVVTQPDSFERLQALRSQFWSFVPVQVDEWRARGLNRVP
jgi:hypothetical protein